MLGRRRGRDAAKQECDVDARLGIKEKIKVLCRARRQPFLDFHSGALKELDVATRVAVVHAGIDACCQDDLSRWSGTYDLGKRPRKADDQHNGKHDDRTDSTETIH